MSLPDLPPCDRCKKPRGECDCVPDLTVSPDGQMVTIFGVRYDIELFRHLGVGPIGSRIEILAREDGMVTLRRIELPEPPKPSTTAVLSVYTRAMQAAGVPHEPLQVYDSNSWRRVGLASRYSEVVTPFLARDGHPDVSGVNALRAMVAAFNAMLELRRGHDT